MSAISRTTIGFDRKIEIEWLDAVAGCVATGQAPEDVRKFLMGFLEGVVAGDSVHSGRGKTLTVLSRIWVIVPEHARPLRKAALQCIGSATREQRVAIHWAMAIGTYPFFCDVAASVGKLLALNGHANLSQVGRRMIETWGDRSTLPRAIQRVLRSMVQWGAVRDGPARGTFVAPTRRTTVPDQIGELLLQAVLVSRGRGMPLPQLTGHPALFPFGIHLSATAMRQSGCIQVQREGDQSDFIELGQGSRRQR
jgi:hypothetical protein